MKGVPAGIPFFNDPEKMTATTVNVGVHLNSPFQAILRALLSMLWRRLSRFV